MRKDASKDRRTIPPGLRTLKISPYTLSNVGAWTVASMAYTIGDIVISLHLKDLILFPTCVKGVLSELGGELGKVALDELELIGETSGGSVLASPSDLEVVVIQADDVDVAEAGDFTGGATDAAPDVEDLHSRSEGHLGGEVMFMAGELGGQVGISARGTENI